MKKIIIISAKSLYWGAVLLLLTSACLYFVFIDITAYYKHSQVSKVHSHDEIKVLIDENEKMRGILESVLPDESQIIYESPYRYQQSYSSTPDATSLNKVISEGSSVDYTILYNDSQYIRPIYHSDWTDFYYRGWLSLPQKIEQSRHRLFSFPLGASGAFDFLGSLGFTASPSVNTHQNKNFVIYHFNIEKIKRIGHQMAFIGTPQRSGIQIVSIMQDELLTADENEEIFLFQLSTPKGYEIDFLYEPVTKLEYLKEKIESNSVKPAFETNNNNPSLDELKNQNQQLIKQLSNYIPLQKQTLTEKECQIHSTILKAEKVAHIQTAYQSGSELEYKVHYRNLSYQRPIYHPVWKKNAVKGWSYIPAKICENMHNLFIIPIDSNSRQNLMGRLGFQKPYPETKQNELPVLIYNLDIKEIIKYQNQIIILGIPLRTGIEIVSFDTTHLLHKKKYVLQLSTPDFFELDYHVLQVQ